MEYCIVVSEFNSAITELLLQKCLQGFHEQNILPSVYKVPGAVEIPLMIQEVIKIKKPAAVVALGCVVKGETDHYNVVCQICAQGIMEVMLQTHTPVVFEVLMVDTLQKAQARVDKGHHAAYTAVRLSKLIRSVS